MDLRKPDEFVVLKHDPKAVWQIIPLVLAAVLLAVGLAMFMSGTQQAIDVVQPVIVVFGGTLVALLITFPLQQLTHALHFALVRGVRGGTSPAEMVRAMVDVCDVCRREGLLGVAEVRSNSVEVEEVCHLIGDAATATDIEQGWDRRLGSERMLHQLAQDVFALTSIYAILIGAMASIVRMVGADDKLLTGANVLPFVAGVCLTILTTMLIGRLRSVHLKEMVVVEIAYRGATIILDDNNVQRLGTRLSMLVPQGLRN